MQTEEIPNPDPEPAASAAAVDTTEPIVQQQQPSTKKVRQKKKSDLQVSFELENQREDAYKKRFGLPAFPVSTSAITMIPVDQEPTSDIDYNNWLRTNLGKLNMMPSQINVVMDKLSTARASTLSDDYKVIYRFWESIKTVWEGQNLGSSSAGKSFGDWLIRFLEYCDTNPNPTLEQIKAIGIPKPTLMTDDEASNANLTSLRANLEAYISTTYPEFNKWKDSISYDANSQRSTTKQKDLNNQISHFYQSKDVGLPTPYAFDSNTYQHLIRYERLHQPPASTIGHGVGMTKKAYPKTDAGKGIEADDNDRYVQFGKFCFFVPQLQKRVFHVKYAKSKGCCPRYPRTLISTKFTDFLLDLLETKNANLDLFRELNDKEQKLFKKLATEARVLNQLGMREYHFDDTDDEDLERFELLRGEVMAGQNNPDVLRELRGLILKFISDGRLNWKEGHGLLAQISLVL
jgi:hypothetical protein